MYLRLDKMLTYQIEFYWPRRIMNEMSFNFLSASEANVMTMEKNNFLSISNLISI